MRGDILWHIVGLSVAFGAVAIGSYGLMQQLVLVGLLPLPIGGPRSVHRELAHRWGVLAARRGWFETLRETARRDLTRARQIDVPADDFVGLCLTFATGGAIVAWLLTLIAGGAAWNLVPATVAAVILFQVPAWTLKSRMNTRITRLTRRLPYSVEVVVLAMEAGSGFEESLAILVRQEPDEPLHEEFDQALRDAQMGRTRREVLLAMAGRVDTEDVSSLVMAINISDELGTSLGPTLKKQAETIRNNRLQRAERMAREAGPKMALPNTMIMVANVLLILAPFLPKLSMGGGF
jgi:pilus assembly protein TadC